MRPSTSQILPLLFGVSAAWTPLWTEPFSGPVGTLPDRGTWDITLAFNSNGDIQEYTSSTTNLQLSGHDTLQVLPRRDPATGRWTSGRIESRGAWAPAPGRRLRIQADLRLGPGAPEARTGLWPAFWVLGDVMRRGTPWPVCGEMDIFEHRNGDAVAHGVMHCGTVPEAQPGWHGGVCGEPLGRGAQVVLPDYRAWHTWTIVWDRTPGDWRRESVTWLKDGVPFHVVHGETIGDEGVWASLAHSKVYIILNVAIGT